MNSAVWIRPKGFGEGKIAADSALIAGPEKTAIGGWAAKRLIDITSSVLGIIVMSPVLLMIGLMILAGGGGPVLFRQIRVGRGGRAFRVLKFRTMVRDAEARLAGIEGQTDSIDGVLFYMNDDPRVTRLGRVLRRTSLDELPQLFNVLWGDMSLVGPRPLQLRDCARLSIVDPDAFRERLAVSPGLTGLVQVSGRKHLPAARTLELDRKYVSEWSLLLDLKILCKTIPIVLSGNGAS